MVCLCPTCQELCTDTEESLLRPLIKPVNGAAVDERGEHAEAVTQLVTYGTHTQDDMEVLAHAINEVREHELA